MRGRETINAWFMKEAREQHWVSGCRRVSILDVYQFYLQKLLLLEGKLRDATTRRLNLIVKYYCTYQQASLEQCMWWSHKKNKSIQVMQWNFHSLTPSNCLQGYSWVVESYSHAWSCSNPHQSLFGIALPPQSLGIQS